MCPPPSSLSPPPQRQQPPPPRQEPPPQPRQEPTLPPRQEPTPPPRQQPPSPRQQPPSPRQQPPSPRQQPPSPHQPTPPNQSPSPRQQLLSPHQPPPPRQSPSPRQQPPPSHPPPPPQQPPPPPPNPPVHQPLPPPPPPQPQPSSHPPQLQPPPQQQYPQPPYPPYHYLHQRPKKKSSTLASCFLATSFLIFITIAATITCFILFRPLNPIISVQSMKFPSFSLLNGTANFTFFQYVAVRNPNRYAFSHYDSSLQLFSSSSGPLGFMYIPAGNIAAGKTQFMSATFDVKSFTLPSDVSGPQNGPGPGPGPTMELETKMKLVGSVKVFQVFAHHVEKGAKCRVSIQVSDGSVLGYKC